MTEIKNLPVEDESNIVQLAFKSALSKAGWTTEKINEIYETSLWGVNAENNLDLAIGKLEGYGIDKDYFIKKYNQLITQKRKDQWKQQEQKEKKKILGRFNPLTIYENVEEHCKENPFFYDKTQLFWFWDKEKYRWAMVDETELLNSIEEQLQIKGQIVTSNLLSKYIKSFQAIGRKNKPKEPPKEYIQFKNKVFNIKTKEMFDASPEYFFCNPLPYEIGKTDKTPIMNKLFQDWVGEENVQSLYEIIAYCCYADYPIHSLFCLIGSGRNGKSRFLALINKFIGTDNVCSTELDTLVDSRFESAKMYKKLVCLMGETNFGTMSKTSLIKKLTGQDLIGYEFKNKLPFDEMNYAKLLISSNSLPISSDTSEGFYRRWMILDFANQFPEGRDILEIIPEEEYNNLANKITNILPELLQRGKFTNQGSIEQRKEKYIMASNPISLFIKDFCTSNEYDYMKYNQFFLAYLKFLKFNKRRRITKKEFGKNLEDEGIDVERTTKDGESAYWVFNVKLLPDWEEKMTKMTKMTQLTLAIHEEKKQSESNVINVINITKIDKIEPKIVEEDIL